MIKNVFYGNFIKSTIWLFLMGATVSLKYEKKSSFEGDSDFLHYDPKLFEV